MIGTAESGVPWEDDGVRFPRNLAETWWGSLTAPTRFFAGVNPHGPFARPLLYYLIVTVISAWFELLWGLAGTASAYAPIAAELGVPERTLAVLAFFLSPFYGLLLLALGVGILHLFTALLVPERKPIGATARVLCYSIGPAVFTAVPYGGALAGSVWSLVLLVVGLRTMHRTSTGRAVAIVLIPWALALLGLTLLLLAAIALTRLDPGLLT